MRFSGSHMHWNLPAAANQAVNEPTQYGHVILRALKDENNFIIVFLLPEIEMLYNLLMRARF